ncbi:MAG: rRNA maturation RNase YbeY [Limnothrix sp. RL_2_0]|nr:rRNA maturation RNase YbeY [Limnothrix sp. RL_2_0]
MNCEIFVENTFGQDLPELAIAPWQNHCSQWLRELPKDLPSATNYELTLRFTTDAEIHGLNRQYRAKDQPTDVLSFAALEDDLGIVLPDDEPVYLGDIIVSVDTAQRQAIARNHSLEVELGWLTSHGLLHLLGWDHPDEDRLIEMLDRQEMLLRNVQLIP